MSLAILLVLLLGLTLAIGLLIGAIGIGGVLVVPMLVYLGGIEIHVAIAIAMFSYLCTGAVGVTVYARRGSIRWPMAIWLSAGAMPAAFAGAWAVNALPGGLLEGLIALFVVLTGANALRPRSADAAAGKTSIGQAKLLAIGATTGICSTMTGTGGPLILMPILLWLDLPVLTTIGLAQAIQLPIATFATAGNLIYGRLDLVLGLVVAAGLGAGAFVGAHGAHLLSQAVLKRVIGAVLVAVGLYLAAPMVIRFLSYPSP